jgi:hypothetical protein
MQFGLDFFNKNMKPRGFLFVAMLRLYKEHGGDASNE